MGKAVEYADQFGWKVVPLSPSPEVAEEDSDDPVIRLLGRSPLIEVPAEATACPEELRELTGIPVASLALLTGEASNIAAVEIGPAAERGLDRRELKQFRGSLPNTRQVCGPDRDYYLFSLPSVEEGSLNLPRLTRSDGVILHGEGSLIRIPGPRPRVGVRAFRWGLQGNTGVAPFPKELLSFFGIKTGVSEVVSWSNQSSGETERVSSATGVQQSKQQTSSPSGISSVLSSSGERSRNSSLSFRSGEDLCQTSDHDPGIEFSWLAEGTLSLLCGPTKTAGKSTFVANLVAHLAAGRSFLGKDLEASRVVLWSDLPASQFRSILSRIGIDRDARARLHVVHPEDARRQSWQTLLNDTFDFTKRQDAALVVLDSLDQFVEVKGGVDPRTDVDVVHALTTEAPPESAVLAVQALSSSTTAHLSRTIDRLKLLGKAADVVAKMDSCQTEGNPALRRIQFASRLEGVPSHVLCEMIRGRYQKVRRAPCEVGMPRGDGRATPTRNQENGPLPEITKSDGQSHSGQEAEVSDGSGLRPSLVQQELAGSNSDS